jgi:hypothetical protein
VLEDLFFQLQKEKTVLSVSGLHKQLMFKLIRLGLFDKIRKENFLGDVDEALVRARSLVNQ